jgi:hypothetical protein
VERQEQGRRSFVEIAGATAHKLRHVVGGGAGYAAHGPVGAAVGAAIPAVAEGAMKLGGRVARGVDYRLAQRARAAALPPPPSVPIAAPVGAVPAVVAASPRREPSAADLYAPAF